METKIFFKTLSKSCSLDPYLYQIHLKCHNHKFLRGATQGVYKRQVSLLVQHYKNINRERHDVKVLDWGAGKGHITYLLKLAGFDVTSCDLDVNVDDSSFGQATPIIEEQNIEVVALKHGHKLPFDEATFDLVVSFGVLEHVNDDQKSLIEIRRILKHDGRLFFTFLPYHLSWTQKIAHLRKNYYHDHLYSLKKIRTLAERANFTVEHLWHGQLFPKNSMAHSNFLEWLDRSLTFYTPLKYFATNVEGFLKVK